MVTVFRDQAYFEADATVAVLTTQPINRFLDYKAPQGGCFQGAFVEVPLGPRKVLGVVWGAGTGEYDAGKIRSIINVIDVPPMRAEMQEFLTKVGKYTLTAMSAMLRLATRAPGLTDSPATLRIFGLADQLPTRMTPARKKVIDVLKNHDGTRFTKNELARLADVGVSVINGLAEQGVLEEFEAPRDGDYPVLDAAQPGKDLTEEQARIAKVFRGKVAQQAFSALLLKGVTGSGKTEVYLEAVAECIAQGRQALVLLPEIALTGAFLDRVELRFGARAAEWHSGVTVTERRRCWRLAGKGQVQLVAGARSALFLPFQNLGLIVVDEEHDPSYKQEDGVLYNARDMAVLRASNCAASVVLASATPSLESWANAKSGKYERFDLNHRFGAAELPEMKAIDLRNESLAPGRWISDTLAREVFARLERKEQSLLFLNRRGYAPVTVCRACGEQIGCDDCDARLVEHRFQERLMCHQCGETKPIPRSCPSCQVEGQLSVIGPGVERLAEEAKERFEGARIAVLSSDLSTSTNKLQDRIRSIAQGNADVIIGTQLVAKGHNFPLLTCVGVIDADLGLQGSDLRAAERTFQLIRQVAGRSGRAHKKGTAFVQTLQPEHPVIKAILSGEEEEFWSTEAAQREMAGSPPFGRMAGIILSGPDLALVMDVATFMVRNAEPLRRINAQVYGPAPAPIARVRGQYRVRILVKAAKEVLIQPALASWHSRIKPPPGVRISIDIDPQSFH